MPKALSIKGVQSESMTSGVAAGADASGIQDAAGPQLHLVARFQPSLNAALWQNSVPVLSEMSVTNDGSRPAGDIEVVLASEPAVLRPRAWRCAGPVPGQTIAFGDLDVSVDGAALSAQTEATRGTVTLVAHIGEAVVATSMHDIRILAANEWGGTASIPDILAAFVQPNDPPVGALLHAASDLMRASGKPDSFEGYQGSKARVWEQAQAIWSAICRMDLRYVNPPPSFVVGGQRIRGARQIAEERLATCLDLAVLFCSCLEAAGLRPLVVLQREHAFAGLWLSKGDFGTSTVDDAPGLRTRLKLDDLRLFETTGATHARKPTFQQATDMGAANVEPAKDAEFEGLIDIHRARQRRILPLASVTTGYAFQAAADTAEAALPTIGEAPPLREDVPYVEELPPATAEDRLARWRKRLLDLSGRNRLLNLPTASRQVLWLDCPDPAGLEDHLANMRGRGRTAPLRFRPWPDLMDGADPRSATLHRNRLQEQATLAYAREAMAKGELMVGRDEASLQASLTEIYRKARADQQEGGANTLFLTIGTLLWTQKDRDKPYRAPLILVPVVLERPSVRSGFVLRVHDDETRLNATLLELLRQDFAIRLPSLEAERPPEDAAGFDVAAIMDAFRAKARDIRGWEVRDEVALTTLSFTKFLMWKDLTDRVDMLRGNEVSRRLIDGASGADAGGGRCEDPAMPGCSADGSVDETLAASDLYCPLEGDSSQLKAVARAATGESFVLIGPPGTGKSQTIANIIANTLAQGRTVLFVAEKRAALEVVQRRLREVGLADFCLDLFSSKVNKTVVLAQLDQAQSASGTDDPAAWRTAQADLATLRGELNGYVSELHRAGRNGWTPFRAIGTVMRGDDGGIPHVALSWPEADVHDVGASQRLVETIEEAAEVLRRAGDVVRRPTLLGIERTDWSPLWQARLLDAARGATARLAALERGVDAVCRALHLEGYPRSRGALQRLCDLAGVLTDPIAVNAAWSLADGAAALHATVLKAEKDAERYRTLRAALTGTWRPGVQNLPLTTLRGEWRAAAGKWALTRSMGQRAVRRRLAEEAEGPPPEDVGAELDRLIELQAIEAAVPSASDMTPLGPEWRGLDSDFVHLRAAHDWAGRLRLATAACAADAKALADLRTLLSRLVAGGADLLSPAATLGATFLRLTDAWREAEQALAAATNLSGGAVSELADEERPDWADALARLLSGWTEASGHIQEWCAWRGIGQRAAALGLAPLVKAMEGGAVGPDEAVRALEANYARWWIDLAVDASPRLRGFVAAVHETRIERFRALDARTQDLAARLARGRLAASVPGAAARQADPEFAVLARELAKRQRHLPIRQLASRMPKALRRLTPCLMMSPLSVAQYLPAESEPFDLVVFDEASQITTWDAIGAIGRGRQVVVVGDPRQLPPTSFFERRSDGEEDAAAEVETHDLESILDECLGAGIPTVELTWHYRSRSESLIAFSNQVYYGGRLVTFPSPVTRDDAVSFRFVADGVYARGAGRTNQPEARAVVAEALAVLRADERRSLGIVTFNAEQQGLIEDLLDKARDDDPSLEMHFGDEAHEPVLIKNLEGIQGEERDVMLFSLTYGPDTTGRVALNFGPLNLAGGERRLNVAVTRARETLVVFGSIRAEQIDLTRTDATGVQHLKRFLAFAERGARSFVGAAPLSQGEHESLFELEVAERLERLGWTTHPQIGVSGFRIDLGVVDPDAAGSYLAGVECDGATYHRGATARDRDRLRQQVLEGLGWRILRVWSTDWWINAAREAERLHIKLLDLLTEVRARREAATGTAALPKPAPIPMEALPVPERSGEPEGMASLDTTAAVSAPDSAGPAPELFYEPSYRERLAAIVADILRTQGPMREERLLQAVARLHGFGRVGREIRERVMSALPSDVAATTEEVGRFLWPPGIDPAAWNTFRAPSVEHAADPSEIPLPELVALAKKCLLEGADDETVLLAMRNACGLQRLREAARARCMAALVCARSSPYSVESTTRSAR